MGRNEAVVDLKFLRITGFLAWLIWTFLHVYYLIEFDNKLIVLIQWGWNYFTHRRGARLITGRYMQVNSENFPPANPQPTSEDKRQPVAI